MLTKGQEDGITIRLGFGGYYVGWMKEEDKGIVGEVGTEIGGISCPSCGPAMLYRYEACKPVGVLRRWSNGTKVYFELHR